MRNTLCINSIRTQWRHVDLSVIFRNKFALAQSNCVSYACPCIRRSHLAGGASCRQRVQFNVGLLLCLGVLTREMRTWIGCLRVAIKRLALIAGIAGWVASAGAQSFVNLDFESANGIDPSGLFINWNLAAPGWEHGGGGDTVFVFHKDLNTNITSFYYLVDSNSPSLTPLAGNYSLALFNGHNSAVDPSSPFLMAWIAQLGDIPANARSFTMLATGPFSVTINGINVPMLNFGGNLWGGDVTGFAGDLSAALRIQDDSLTQHGMAVFDNLGFSANPVPEPGSFALLASGLGILTAAVVRRRKKR
jgi:PEP-CTERM motif